METLMLAGTTAFDLDGLAKLLANGFKTELQDKAGGLRFLVLQNSAGFVAKIQACSKERDQEALRSVGGCRSEKPICPV